MPSPGRERADQAQAVVDPRPLRSQSMKILPTRFLPPALATNICGIVFDMCSTTALVNAFDESQSAFGLKGTTTCRPFPPLVFKNAESPRSSRKDFMSSAACWIIAQSTPSPGSRSKTTRSGRSYCLAVAFCVWTSTTFHWAADRSPSEVATSSMGGCSGSSA